MSENQSEDAAPTREDFERSEARRMIKKRRDLGEHLVVYVIVNGVLWGLWALTGAGYPWPAWITGGWAIGLAMQTWDVYIRRPITESDVDRELQRMRGGGRTAAH